ncbi:MAG: hypothetical protein FWB85_07740 [Chitinispirillia bacterium]|nr:hypothetical protein [Chitinispirillia bacterium]MCL2242163.1 hypothetical protein [Chitinispirillia bacterium]
MNIGINGYRQMQALGAEALRAQQAPVNINSGLDADKKAIDVANVPGGTKRMAIYLLETKQAKDVDDALDKASNPGFKAKSFGDMLGEKMNS